MAGNVIVAGARTPMGRLLGSLKGLSAAQLGGVAIAGALDRAGVSPDQVDYVIMGHVASRRRADHRPPGGLRPRLHPGAPHRGARGLRADRRRVPRRGRVGGARDPAWSARGGGLRARR